MLSNELSSVVLTTIHISLVSFHTPLCTYAALLCFCQRFCQPLLHIFCVLYVSALLMEIQKVQPLAVVMYVTLFCSFFV